MSPRQRKDISNWETKAINRSKIEDTNLNSATESLDVSPSGIQNFVNKLNRTQIEKSFMKE